MQARSLQQFIHAALGEQSTCWYAEKTQEVGDLQVPPHLYGDRAWMFRGDVHRLWAEWFLGAWIDISRLHEDNVTYAYVYSTIWSRCCSEFGNGESTELLTRLLAELTYERLEIMKAGNSRHALSRNERIFLIDLAGEKPRCWVCGHEFSNEAIENFVDKTTHTLQLPSLVDILKPKGIYENDLRIEIDHVLPFSKGGGRQENLKIACGWCNRYKSNFTCIYDVSGSTKTLKLNHGVYFSSPQPFWVVRLLALASKYEAAPVYQKKELTVTWRNRLAKATPPNLKIVSYDEVPNEQMQNRALVQLALKRAHKNKIGWI